MKPNARFFREILVPTVLFFAAALGLMQFDLLQNIDNMALDGFTRLRATLRPTPPPEALMVVGINEESIRSKDERFGRWPWPRSVHGDFLTLLGAAKAGVVTWDIMFTEATRDKKEDADFLDGIKTPDGAEVVMGAVGASILDGGVDPNDKDVKAARLEPLLDIEGDRTKVVPLQGVQVPAGELGQAAHSGFVNDSPGTDGVRHFAPMFIRIGDNFYPSLGLETLLQYWKVKPAQVKVRLGEAIILATPQITRRIPIDAAGNYFINYRHASDGYRPVDYSSLFGWLVRHLVNGEDVKALPSLQGKILLVGQTANGLADFGPTPLGTNTPLVLVHANVIENVLNEDYARHAPVAPIWLGAFALGLIGLAVFSKRKVRDHAFYALGVPVVYAGVSFYSWEQWSIWLPLVGPVLGFLALQVFEVGRRVIVEQKAKQEIKGMFGTYVSPALVSKMIDSGSPPQLGGHDAEITAYFSDIQSFSTFSEKLGSGPLVELMNEYLTACTDIVQGEGGTLDKYIGDAVVAMFGAPIPLPDHAFRACVASQLVHLKLGELREKWRSEGEKWPQIVWNMQTRIGLNSGVCMIGNMGSRTRFNYTMMGDNVNLAARMESGSKAYGAYTMVAEATKLSCEKHGGDRLVFRFLDKIVVKGRSIPVPIYEVVGLKENVTDQTRDCLGVFAEGISRYLVQDWDGAEAFFRKSAEIEPNIPGKTPGVENNPSLTLIKRCDYWRAHPPGSGWTGVYEMKEK